MHLKKSIKTVFDTFGIPHIDHWEKFIALGKLKTYPKGYIIKEAYQTEKYLHIIISGIAISSVWDDNNIQKCTDLYFDNHFFMDYHSFINQQPTPIENQLLSDATLFSIPHKAFIKLIESSPFGDKITRIITDVHFSNKQKQQIDLLTKTASERLEGLISQYPKLLTQVPKKIIASYLGITPQSLSRIIKNSATLNIW